VSSSAAVSSSAVAAVAGSAATVPGLREGAGQPSVALLQELAAQVGFDPELLAETVAAADGDGAAVHGMLLEAGAVLAPPTTCARPAHHAGWFISLSLILSLSLPLSPCLCV
jgi:hypothetical protein